MILQSSIQRSLQGHYRCSYRGHYRSPLMAELLLTGPLIKCVFFEDLMGVLKVSMFCEIS